jgi:hypothetical protein
LEPGPRCRYASAELAPRGRKVQTLVLRRVAAACAASAVFVLGSAAAASAVPGTMKGSSLRSHTVSRAESAASLAQTPPPPPRHFEPPTDDDLPFTGPAIPAPLAMAGGGVLLVLGMAGVGLLRRGAARGLAS